MVKVW